MTHLDYTSYLHTITPTLCLSRFGLRFPLVEEPVLATGMRKRRRGLPSALRAREAGEPLKRFRPSLYTALVPSSTFVNVTSVPNVSFRRFSPCGTYLISLSRNHRDLVVFRFETGGRRSTSTAHTSFPHDLPASAFDARAYIPSSRHSVRARLPPLHHAPCPFARFFTQLHVTPIATGVETLSRDFCLATPRARFIILASFAARDDAHTPPLNATQTPMVPPPPPAAPLPAAPILDRFTLHLVHVDTGHVADRFCLTDDFVPLDGHSGVHMWRDMLVMLSLRNQTLHLIKVQETLGRFSEELRIGASCSPDDELVISRARDAEASWRRAQGKPSAPITQTHPEIGLGNGKGRTGFYTGLMQRLLAYVYRRFHAEGNLSLFYRVVGQYSMLIMQKAQLLDDDHLLIRLGSYERGKDAGTSTCFFVVYCISSTRILNLYENRSTELLTVYDNFREELVGDAAVAATQAPETRGVLNSANSGTEDARRATPRRIRAALASLPICAQMHNASPYLDRKIFSYNVDRLPALDGSRALSLRELNCVKFTSVESGAMRFKLSPGLAAAAGGGEVAGVGRVGGEDRARARAGRRKMLFLFHPLLPFVLSMEYSSVLPTVLNFHVYAGAAH